MNDPHEHYQNKRYVKKKPSAYESNLVVLMSWFVLSSQEVNQR